ncbi:MAG: CarD family transcriptional regulator, partial [Cyanobacteriota bacterium]|nr:CarD family transcriptional regulator [Cyanobacteriota bacterium]
VPLVETEGQWSRRGDLVDIFPVSAELPVRLDWFGDELEKIREFDPSTQRSLDRVERVLLTPTSFSPLIAAALAENAGKQGERGERLEGMRRFLGLAYETPASLLDYLPPETMVAIDELELCRAHGNRWVEHSQEQWEMNAECGMRNSEGGEDAILPKIHRSFAECLHALEPFLQLHLSELAEENSDAIDLSSRPIPTTPHQFAKLAEILRGKREIYSSIKLDKFNAWLISAQPSRSASLLQEHDCPAQFIANPRDFPAIDKYQTQHVPIALKYSGLAELEGFILPTFRLVVVTDREFFGQHVLVTPGYIRKRRRAASKQVDIEKLHPGDYVVHKNHGIGKFLKLDRIEQREYLAIQYADGVLRIPADSFDTLSRFRQTGKQPPELNRISGKAWENAKNKVRKAIKKVAIDLLKLYAERAQQTGYAYPLDTPWQEELEDSFPYQPTPDQLKAIQDVKRDLENDRPMDRLICGDVGFGKTEVAVRAIFKAITGAHKQVAFLAPTTILTQQHYHTLKERFA